MAKNNSKDIAKSLGGDVYGVEPKGGSKVELPKWLGAYRDAQTPTQRKSPNPGAIPSQLRPPNPLPNKKNSPTKRGKAK
jgi:hypothetical protein